MRRRSKSLYCPQWYTSDRRVKGIKIKNNSPLRLQVASRCMPTFALHGRYLGAGSFTEKSSSTVGYTVATLHYLEFFNIFNITRFNRNVLKSTRIGISKHLQTLSWSLTPVSHIRLVSVLQLSRNSKQHYMTLWQTVLLNTERIAGVKRN